MAFVLAPCKVEGKQCRKCGSLFTHENFFKDKNRKDGLHPWCKACIVEKNKTYRNRVKTQEKQAPTEKFCPDCATVKPASLFSALDTNLSGLYTYCNDCKNTRNKATRYRAAYGFSKQEARELALNDVRTCEICGTHGRVVVDHCHDTGAVRGFLCNSCNVVLGFAKNNASTLQKAAAYLERVKV